MDGSLGANFIDQLLQLSSIFCFRAVSQNYNWIKSKEKKYYFA
jgi:hypothetical protein